MPYLDAALAFALTMLAVATLVTQIVRLVHGASKFRFNQLKKMLIDYFDNELKPVIKREVWDPANKKVDQTIKDEVKKLADKDFLDELRFSDEELEKLVEVSKEEFMERLKRSALGEKLLEKLKDEAEYIFSELEKRYQLIEKKFTESFRVNARWWATGVALALAFALNIDSIFILNTYITNQDMRQAVVEQGNALEEGYTTLAEKFKGEQEKIEITKEEFEEMFGETQAQLDVFTSAGFPIGWSYYPYAALRGESSKDYQERDNTLGFVMWIAGCLLTGLLAGLGGPFWYDIVAGISQAAKSVRGQKN